MKEKISVPCLGQHLIFCCEHPGEAERAKQILTKEPGTSNWLSEFLKPADLFYDIGANIGTYTLLAALMQPDCQVVAFEPHSPNLVSLLENLHENRMLNRVAVVSSPLSSSASFGPFYYSSLQRGASQNQFDRLADDLGRPFTPIFTEHKTSIAIDQLIASGKLNPPNLVKIDVDGNECDVILGMRSLLSSDLKPRSVQVEVSPSTADRIKHELINSGYHVHGTHYTNLGKRLVAQGADLSEICYNIIFVNNCNTLFTPLEGTRPCATGG